MSFQQVLEVKKTKNYREHVLEKKIKSDFEIVIRSKTIKAHKIVLGVENSVFSDHFLSHPEVNKLEILDLHPNAVEVFIDYLYTGKITEGDITEDLLLVAHKYSDSSLKRTCREKLSNTLTIENAPKRLLIFLECEENKLIEEASFLLAKNYNAVKNQFDFKQVLEKPNAISAIFDVFDCGKVTALLGGDNPTRKNLIDELKKSNITIKVQDEYFLGHKDTLSRNPDLNSRMINSQSASQISCLIEIPKFNASIFKHFLKFLYTRHVEKENISKELLCIAYEYSDARLKKICEDHLCKAVCEENAIEFLELGVTVESEKLKEEASLVIVDKYNVMKEQAAFKKMTMENPLAVAAVFDRFDVINDNLSNNETLNFKFILKDPRPEDTDRTEATETKSKKFNMKNVPWFVTVTWAKEDCCHLGIYLDCVAKGNPKGLKVEFVLKLISHIDKKHNVTCSFRHDFGLSDKSFGEIHFVCVDDLDDEGKGLLKDGLMTVKLTATFDK